MNGTDCNDVYNTLFNLSTLSKDLYFFQIIIIIIWTLKTLTLLPQILSKGDPTFLLAFYYQPDFEVPVDEKNPFSESGVWEKKSFSS